MNFRAAENSLVPRQLTGAGLALSNRLVGASNKSVLVFTKIVRIRTCRGEKSGREAEHHGRRRDRPGETSMDFKVSVTKDGRIFRFERVFTPTRV